MVTMETVVVQLKHAKAKQLLQNVAEMDLIQVIGDASLLRKPVSPISDLKGQIHTPMTEEQINQQLEQLRNDWERTFD